MRNPLVTLLALALGTSACSAEAEVKAASAEVPASTDGTSSADAPVRPQRLSLHEFETSQFCRSYGCVHEDQWDLRGGDMNHVYDVNISNDIMVEVQTNAEGIVGGGLKLYGVRLPTLGFVEMSNAFVEYYTEEECSGARGLIDSNLTKDVNQIRKATSVTCGGWKVYAGRVLNPTLSIRRTP